MVIFATGLETADCATHNYCEFTATSSDVGTTLEVSTTQKNSGEYSSRSIAGFAYGGDDSYAYAYKTFTAATTTYLRFYAYVDSVTVANNSHFFIAQLDDEYFELAAVGVRGTVSGNKLYIQWRDSGGGQSAVSATNFPAIGSWHCFEVMRKKDATTGEIDVWLDGSEIADLHQTGLDTSGYTIDRVRVGPWGSYIVSGDIIESFVDDIIINSSYIGPLAGGVPIPVVLRRMLIGVGRILKTPIYEPKELIFPKFMPKIVA